MINKQYSHVMVVASTFLSIYNAGSYGGNVFYFITGLTLSRLTLIPFVSHWTLRTYIRIICERYKY